MVSLNFVCLCWFFCTCHQKVTCLQHLSDCVLSHGRFRWWNRHPSSKTGQPVFLSQDNCSMRFFVVRDFLRTDQAEESITSFLPLETFCSVLDPQFHLAYGHWRCVIWGFTWWSISLSSLDSRELRPASRIHLLTHLILWNVLRCWFYSFAIIGRKWKIMSSQLYPMKAKARGCTYPICRLLSIPSWKWCHILGSAKNKIKNLEGGVKLMLYFTIAAY